MEELKDCCSVEEIEQILHLAEVLQTENEALIAENKKLISENESLKLTHQKLIQDHSSETQELILQISSMKSGIAELGQMIQEKDEEIVKLNGKLEKNAGSDLIFKENARLKDLVQEVTTSSDKKIKKARKMMDDAKAKTRIAEANQRDFNRHLHDESNRIRRNIRQQWDHKMSSELGFQKTKMTIWTNSLFACHICLLINYMVSFDLMQDIINWISFVGYGVSEFISWTFSIIVQGVIQSDGSIVKMIVSKLMAVIFVIIIYGFIGFVLLLLGAAVYEEWTPMWSRYGSSKEDMEYRAAHIFALLSIQGTIAAMLRVSLPPPWNFNFINWWLILFVITLEVYRKFNMK